MSPTVWPAAAFFDLDGTLMDREPLAQAAVLEAAAQRGVHFSEEEVAPLVGRAWQDVHRALEIQEVLGWPYEEFLDHVLGQARDLLAAGFITRVLEGGVELIQRLRAADVPVWLVTGSLRREADDAIRHLAIGELLSGSLAAEEYGLGKPDPGCYLKAAGLAGVGETDIGRCLVVEDSEAGVAAGLAAGMRVLATTAANRLPGHPSFQDVSAAHVVVASLADVDDALIDRLLSSPATPES